MLTTDSAYINGTVISLSEVVELKVDKVGTINKMTAIVKVFALWRQQNYCRLAKV